MTVGIYQIRNLVNGKIYLGSSINIDRRWYSHECNLNGNYHENNHLQRAFDKYGADNFIFEVLLICDEIMLSIYEQLLLDNYVVWSIDYNINKCVDRFTFTDEVKQKMSGSRASMSGVNHPMYGKECSEETKHKISMSLKGANHPMYGKTFSEARRRKQSDALKGNQNAKGKTYKRRIKVDYDE